MQHATTGSEIGRTLWSRRGRARKMGSTAFDNGPHLKFAFGAATKDQLAILCHSFNIFCSSNSCSSSWTSYAFSLDLSGKRAI